MTIIQSCSFISFLQPPTPEQQAETPQQQQQQQQEQDRQRRDIPQDPPESTFKKLAPSENRYSFRDEL